MMFVMLVAGQG